jgi:hypothetical protein
MNFVKHILLVGSLLLPTMFNAAQDLEQRILENLTRSRTPGMTHFMQDISNTTSTFPIATLVTLFIFATAEKDHDLRKKSSFIGETIVLS